MKSKSLLLIYVIVISVITILFITVIKKNKNLETELTICLNSNYHRILNDITRDSLKLSTDFMSYFIDNNVTNLSGDTIELSSFLGGNKVFFCYSQLDCSTCVDSCLYILDSFVKTNLDISPIVIGSKINRKRLGRLIRINNYGFEIFVLNGELDIPLARAELPFFGVFENNTIHSTFAVSTGKEKEIKMYLEGVFSYLKNAN